MIIIMYVTKRIFYVLILLSCSASAAQIEIDVNKEADLKNGYYIAPESGGQGRYALISHSHGAFEGSSIAQAECTNGYTVSKLPSRFNFIKKVLHSNDYILTSCKESY